MREYTWKQLLVERILNEIPGRIGGGKVPFVAGFPGPALTYIINGCSDSPAITLGKRIRKQVDLNKIKILVRPDEDRG